MTEQRRVHPVRADDCATCGHPITSHDLTPWRPGGTCWACACTDYVRPTTDPRRTQHWPAPMHQTEDDIPTLVPCFLCSGAGCEDCARTGLVPPDVRQAQREAAGNPSSGEQCDTRRKP